MNIIIVIIIIIIIYKFFPPSSSTLFHQYLVSNIIWLDLTNPQETWCGGSRT